MSELTRRGFIKRASAGAATLGAAAAMPGLLKGVQPAEAAARHTATAFDGPLVAHVANAETGEISLLVGTREVIIRDHELVARLVRAAR